MNQPRGPPGFFFGKQAVAINGPTICASVLISHSLTYMILDTGPGFEMNPLALGTLWVGPMVDISLWEGGMAGLTTYLWDKFERHKELVLALIIPMLVMTVFDAANDIIVALHLGLFG
jgi:hypothetical protein